MTTISIASAYRPFQFRQVFKLGLVWLIRCHQRSVQRHQLAQLDDDRLRDIGVSREQVFIEVNKHCWHD